MIKFKTVSHWYFPNYIKRSRDMHVEMVFRHGDLSANLHLCYQQYSKIWGSGIGSLCFVLPWCLGSREGYCMHVSTLEHHCTELLTYMTTNMLKEPSQSNQTCTAVEAISYSAPINGPMVGVKHVYVAYPHVDILLAQSASAPIFKSTT